MLLSDLQSHKLEGLSKWFGTSQGKDVAVAILTTLQKEELDLSGRFLLQLGNFDSNIWLEPLNYKNRFLLSPTLSPSNCVQAAFDYLPFDKNSLDCIVLPFTLELLHSPLRLIDELNRVLNAMGHLIFIGINPFSFWGAWAYFGHGKYFRSLAKQKHTAYSIKDQLVNKGYILSSLSYFYNIPPLSNEKWFSKLACLNKFGKLLYPYPAGFYCLVLQKYQVNPIPYISDPAKHDLLYI